MYGNEMYGIIYTYIDKLTIQLLDNIQKKLMSLQMKTYTQKYL